MPPPQHPYTGTMAANAPPLPTNGYVKPLQTSSNNPLIRTIPELLSVKAKQQPDEPILGYPMDDLEYNEYTFATLERFASNAASLYAKMLPIRKTSNEAERIVALLGPSTFDFVISTLALLKLGFTVLFLSTRLSEAAYLSLLEATNCRHVAHHSSFKETLNSMQQTLSGLECFDILDRSVYENAQERPGLQAPDQKLDLDQETKKYCWIIHSSGTTSLPKPIPQRHQNVLRGYETNMNVTAFMTLPLFHAGGLSSFFRALTCSKKIYMYNANLPVTRQNLIKVMREHDLEAFYAVPYTLKLVGEEQEGIEVLASMQKVVFGGAPCPDSLGNKLSEAGVNLISYYGCTEMGQLMTSSRPQGDLAWNYVRVNKKVSPYVKWEERLPNMYELVVLPGWPPMAATNRPDGSYATRDLFEPHETIPNAWKYHGRLDDTITLLNGEKAVPVSLEIATKQSRLVQEAVVFGAGESQLGLLIVASDIGSTMPVEQLVAAVWPLIESGNKTLPAYAQIFPEMVKVLPNGTVFPCTDKGTVIRQALYKMFQSDIDEIYRQSHASLEGKMVLSELQLRDCIRQELASSLGSVRISDIGDDIDLFGLGVDSLHASRLRTYLRRNIQTNGIELPQNIVYENPTIAKLASAVAKIRDGKYGGRNDEIDHMKELLRKYSDLPQHIPTSSVASTSSVVVTGATGFLGSHIVHQLTQKDSISEVVCLVRPTRNMLPIERVIQSLEERALYETLSPKQRRKIIGVEVDFSRIRLGLDENAYECLTRNITCLIHCAWSVNFNKGLESFEGDCIVGLRNLMLLCLSAQRDSPATFNFCSSLSTAARAHARPVPESLLRLEDAGNLGYAQSKAVAEHLCKAARDQTALQARILRVGQVVADTQHGIWNTTEAIPLMLRTATTFGALPTLNEEPRWLPVDITAATMVHIALSGTTSLVFNIVNPASFHWTMDLLPALRTAGLRFEEVHPKEWLCRLQASNPDPAVNPTIKLLSFYTNKYNHDASNTITTEYTTSSAQKFSPALRHTEALNLALVQKIVKYITKKLKDEN